MFNRKLYYKKYSKANRLKIKRRNRIYNKLNRNKRRITSLLWRQKNRNKWRMYGIKFKKLNPLKQKQYSFKCKLKGRYNITLNQYKDIKALQNYKCAICNRKVKELVIDHCHKNNKVRGLLCTTCNLGLGGFHDSKKNLNSAIRYLQKPPFNKLDVVRSYKSHT